MILFEIFMNAVVKLAEQLIAKASITPKDCGCQDLITSRLLPLGFTSEKFHIEEVDNLWARFGTESPLLVFAGHTDVVPTGDEKKWRFPPFQPTIADGLLYGRGAADMKGGIAAMIIACEKFLKDHPSFKGSIAFLITSDEEGEAKNGIKKVMQHLINRREKIDFCILGEPSSENQIGDTIKIGRRGSLSATLEIFGTQGHIAYPHLANNPIHLASPFIDELIQHRWDRGNDFFDPTSLQISNIKAGVGADNVIPSSIILQFNLRYSPEISADIIKEKISELIAKYQLKTEITWRHSGKPFLSKQGRLVNICKDIIQEIQQIDTKLSTSGGTSDGRFIIESGCEIVELGLLNQTIHQINESVAIEDLNLLAKLYEKILIKLFL